MNYLPKNITHLRNKAGLSQSQIASRVNKRQTAISSWEKNQSSPSIEDLERLTEIFGISASELLFTDLSAVQKNESSEEQEKGNNVRGNVQTSVQLNKKNSGNPTDLEVLKIQLQGQIDLINSQKETIDGKNDLIASLNTNISILYEEIDRLKRENSELQAQIDSHPGRGGHKKAV